MLKYTYKLIIILVMNIKDYLVLKFPVHVCKWLIMPSVFFILPYHSLDESKSLYRCYFVRLRKRHSMATRLLSLVLPLGLKRVCLCVNKEPLGSFTFVMYIAR